MKSFCLSPAYGKIYKNRDQARDDFEAGRDFILRSFCAPSTYISKRDIPNGARVLINFEGGEFSFVAGSARPLRHATKSLAPCGNCGQWKRDYHGNIDCMNDCVKRGFEPR